MNSAEVPQYQTSDLASAFDVKGQTIIDWTAKLHDHLSPHARPEKGQTRAFTQSDAEKMALYAQLRKHKPLEEVHARLRNDERGQFQPKTAKALTEHSPTQNELQLTQEVERLMDMVAAQNDQIKILEQRRNTDTSRLNTIIEERTRVAGDLQKRLDEAMTELRKLEHDRGAAYMKGRMDQMQDDLRAGQAVQLQPKPDAPPSPGPGPG